MIFISILFVISFTLNVILALKLKKSNANKEELDVKLKVVTDYADGVVKEKLESTKATLEAKAEVKVEDSIEVLAEKVVDVSKKPRKPRRKKKPNTPKD